ncbi:Cleavage stimulation factor subunit 3 [Microtus ochrogaster]|uniref:Cleavage stimulation factor subunit 3 n=1 Tax=Microtus ochrogaster TaxID=79684 RepID=A0A8J6GTN0_MICOH|nr:Cleavage stimulation factor subunit 3 [Microtus ochrogaster]
MLFHLCKYENDLMDADTIFLHLKLFQRCLMKVLHIDLWKCYLSYVRETKGKLPSYKEAVGSYAENQRITAVRRVYQRGCVNPMINIEQLWRDYNKYEEGINIHLAKKMIEDRSRDYMNARRVAKEYETVMKGLDRNAPSVPPQNTPQEAQQVDMWKKYIQWEKSNPLRTEDQTLITKRVMFAYEQCLLVLGHHPDIWYEAAQYLEQSKDNNTRVLFERVLTSGSLPPEKSGEIWARFLAFESNIGDLASILKVEKRRFTAFREEYEGKETALLVDRYKFMDLYPCSASELKALGYKDVSRAKLAAIIPDPVVAPSIVPVLKDEVDRKPEYPKPDTQQMIPFQPRHLAPPGLHPVPGGVFPVPPAAVVLMKLLPPPICFQGPFVQVDELMEIFRRCKIPNTVKQSKLADRPANEQSPLLQQHHCEHPALSFLSIPIAVEEAVRIITGGAPELAVEGNGPVESSAVLTKAVKRPNEDSDEDEEKGAVVPPVHDIYRARQQKRIR